MHENRGKSFNVPWTRKLFPLILNGVLENTLVCAPCSLNYHTVPKVHALSRSFWDSLDVFPLLCPTRALWALNGR